ncbi:MAG: low-specificity L-threonine aldolase [Candidatus Fermentithermobacillus carboniphilus]|uniref:Low-specificity L-threonine aldolase n=1 Tax=Candidatus Fermentithermobacillus carboniphilus TaxID=3085328 RepID=A0AAT9LAI5_9FIRM|nr:MAG: low-specificity L-threonine aldolase [Candidatus Fermentithermobacillus carboniphilus]
MPEKRVIDLRSDTVTKPTPEMREAMARAEVGDDVYGEDPTVNRLEALGAEMVGKEAAVFVPSGTMGNQISVMSWTERGDEIILESQSHIYMYEVGATAVLSQVQVRPIPGHYGAMDPEEVALAIRKPNIHFPRTRLICLENTHNRSGGCVVPLDNMKRIYEIAKEKGVFVHLDGARVFNAAVALGVDVKEITKYADSVQFCLSKGLCAPVGSLVAGPRTFVDRARKYRKMLGGGMRQAGILAAAGIIALEKMTKRLHEDHANAKRLAEGLSRIPGLGIDMASVQTNMVAVSTRGLGMDGPEFVALMKPHGVLFNADLPYRVRMVTHNDVTAEDIDEAIRRIAFAVESLPKK